MVLGKDLMYPILTDFNFTPKKNRVKERKHSYTPTKSSLLICGVMA